MKHLFTENGKENPQGAENASAKRTHSRKLKAPLWWTNFTHSPFMTKLGAFLNKHALLMHIPLSMLMVFAIEWMSRHSFLNTWGFVIHHFGAYLYNCYIVFVLYSIVFLTRRKTFTRMVVSAIIVLLGIVNGIILLNRVSPFGYTDISMIGDLLTMQNTKYFTWQQGLVAVIAIVIYIILMTRLFLKGKKHPSKSPFLVRLILVAACFVSIPFATRGLQSVGVLSSYFGNLAQGYSDYGYLYGFGNSIFGLGMSRPLNYSEDSVKKILADTDQGDSDPLTVDGKQVNVVVVLLESYMDPSEVNFIETNEDPIPYFHELESNYSTGHLTVPVVGAGTCDTEFEMLTGMSMQFFGPGEYPQKTILKQTDVESFASDLHQNLGYDTHVIHDNGANFYSRQNAFAMMGFHDFTSKEMLDITEYNPLDSWPMDGVLIDATRDAMNQTDAPDFTYTITVATHGDYPTYEVFDESDPNVIRVTCDGKDESTTNRWKYYVNMLHEEDQWIRDYIQMLDDRDEPTLVIMFGDHIPTMGLTEDEVATGDLYQTKYITWNNFGMDKEDQDLTSYNLVSAYLGRLGMHGGTMLDYNQAMVNDGVRAGSLQYMNGLEMLQYDLLYGDRYTYDGGDDYPATDIIMGVHDVTIDRVYTFDDDVHIYGNQFTKWSDVYVNGEAVTTHYQSGQHLTISRDNISPGDTIVVNQVGSGEDILRSSNEVIYSDPAAEAEAAEQAAGDASSSSSSAQTQTDTPEGGDGEVTQGGTLD